MRLIQEAADQELLWRQPSMMKQEYELRAGDEVLATLRWQKTFGSLALAETAEASWTFKRSGFWRPRVTARPAGSEDDIATFEPKWDGSGTLTTAGSRHFRLVNANFWRSEWAWRDAGDAPLVRFLNKQVFRTESQVVLSPEAASLPETAQLDDVYQPVPPERLAPPSAALAELPLLVTLGWYLLVLMAQDSAAATATTAAV